MKVCFYPQYGTRMAKFCLSSRSVVEWTRAPSRFSISNQTKTLSDVTVEPNIFPPKTPLLRDDAHEHLVSSPFRRSTNRKESQPEREL
jgi:hypothetical protein